MQLKTTLTENLASVSASGSENFNMPLVSQAEVTRKDPLDDKHGLQYNHPSSNYESTSMEPNTTTYAFSHGNAQMQNLSALSSLMVMNNL